MEAETRKLRELAAQMLPELDTLIGWGSGYAPPHTTPVFVRDPESVSRLIWTPFCVQNLTGYLVKTPQVQGKGGKKVGICVRGCDSRSLTALIQEKFVSRDRLFVIGMPCKGTVDWRRVLRSVPGEGPTSARAEGDRLLLEGPWGDRELAFKDVMARRCRRCLYPTPVLYDVLVGDPVESWVNSGSAYRDVEGLERRSIEERLAFWQTELDRCMRCYACRNACPLCVCQDRCIVEARDPRWLTQRLGLPEKFLFHFIHALHLAGRCTECGECERVCPVGIPVALVKEKLGAVTLDLLGYQAGLDPEAVPPLLTFDPSETGT